MNRTLEEFKTAATAGGFVGAFIGLVVFIWAAIAYIQPALSVDAGLGGIAASFLTLVIALCGGIEITLAGGALLGMLKAATLFTLIYLPILGIRKICHEGPDLNMQPTEGPVHHHTQVPEIVIEKHIESRDVNSTIESPKKSLTIINSEKIEGNETQRPSSLRLFSTSTKIPEVEKVEEIKTETSILK